MMGVDADTPPYWPQCGEIDIIEFVGKLPESVFETIHLPTTTVGVATSRHVQEDLATGTCSHDDHVYAVEWDLNQVRWYVDGQLFGTRTSAEIPANSVWVLNHPFFMR